MGLSAFGIELVFGIELAVLGIGLFWNLISRFCSSNTGITNIDVCNNNNNHYYRRYSLAPWSSSCFSWSCIKCCSSCCLYELFLCALLLLLLLIMLLLIFLFLSIWLLLLLLQMCTNLGLDYRRFSRKMVDNQKSMQWLCILPSEWSLNR